MIKAKRIKRNPENFQSCYITQQIDTWYFINNAGMGVLWFIQQNSSTHSCSICFSHKHDKETNHSFYQNYKQFIFFGGMF